MLEKYIHQYGTRLFGLCLTLCKSRGEAEDLYQETWLRALRYFHKYDPKRAFEPWITRICVNTYRSGLRRAKESPIFDNFGSSEEKDALLSSATTPVGEDYSDLHAAIDRLPEKLRVTIILFYFRDMDLNAAAVALGIPVGTVKSRLNKARKLLKEVLSDETDLQL